VFPRSGSGAALGVDDRERALAPEGRLGLDVDDDSQGGPRLIRVTDTMLTPVAMTPILAVRPVTQGVTLMVNSVGLDHPLVSTGS
jgi:hypothetical protein